jgi:hypothetical protein
MMTPDEPMGAEPDESWPCALTSLTVTNLTNPDRVSARWPFVTKDESTPGDLTREVASRVASRVAGFTGKGDCAPHALERMAPATSHLMASRGL